MAIACVLGFEADSVFSQCEVLWSERHSNRYALNSRVAFAVLAVMHLRETLGADVLRPAER